MKINYKYIEHERTEDAPFVGALISAVDCKFKCKGCFNRDVKKMHTLKREAKDIIAEVKENPINEGIILAGLEWSLQPLELLDLVKEASAEGLKVMIYTGCELSQFHQRLGIACADNVGMGGFINNGDDRVSNDVVYGFIGTQMLDYNIPSDYYIKCGQYDKDNLVADRVQFGVTLASENQVIYKIEKAVE